MAQTWQEAITNLQGNRKTLEQILDLSTRPPLNPQTKEIQDHIPLTSFEKFTIMKRLGEMGDSNAALNFQGMLTEATSSPEYKDNPIVATWFRLWGLTPPEDQEQAQEDRRYLEAQWRDIYSKYLALEIAHGKKVQVPQYTLHLQGVDVGVPPAGLQVEPQESTGTHSIMYAVRPNGDWAVMDRGPPFRVVVVGQEGLTQALTKISTEHPEVVPTNVLAGLGMGTGSASRTTADKLFSTLKSFGGQEVE